DVRVTVAGNVRHHQRLYAGSLAIEQQRVLTIGEETSGAISQTDRYHACGIHSGSIELAVEIEISDSNCRADGCEAGSAARDNFGCGGRCPRETIADEHTHPAESVGIRQQVRHAVA